MKLRYCLLGFAIASLTLLGLSSRNAQAESKTSQCDRFEAVLTRYNDRISDTSNDRISDTSNDPSDPQGIAEIFLVDLNLSIADLESQTFSDATLRSLHQQSLEHIIAGRDNVATYLSATKQGEQAEAEAAFGNLQLLPYQISEVVEQFEPYCGRTTLPERDRPFYLHPSDPSPAPRTP
jgi:hypothetical protein